MKRIRGVARVVAAGLVAAVVVSCGPAAVEIMMGDSGVLTDAGMVGDAGAQGSCGTSCTTGGVQRVMTADSDPAQLVRGEALTSPKAAGYIAQLAAGPLVLTYARSLPLLTSAATRSATFYVSATGSCDPGSSVGTSQRVGLTYDVTGGSPVSSPPITGPIPVASGEVLCAQSGNDITIVTWAGYRPYL